MSEKPVKLQKNESLFVIRWGRSTVNSVSVAEVTHADYLTPIGTVYFTIRGHEELVILHTFVMDVFRRNGIRTMINDKLFEWYPKIKRITSPDSTKTGAAFMKAYGYKKRKGGSWVVHRSRRKKKKE